VKCRVLGERQEYLHWPTVQTNKGHILRTDWGVGESERARESERVRERESERERWERKEERMRE
jgi:hypothetical protein